MHSLTNFNIAGLNLLTFCQDEIVIKEDDSAYRSFFVNENSVLPEDVQIELKLGDMPDTEGLEKVFAGGDAWSIYKDKIDYLMELRPVSFDKDPVWIARFKNDDTRK